MSAVRVNIVQGTPEWHEWRKKGIGASDVAALFGKSPYKTKRDLWFEKAGLGEPDDEDRSYIFRKGHEAEAEIRALFIKHTNIPIEPVCFENGRHLASLDGYNNKTLLEAKLVGKEVLKKASESGEIPEHHWIQVQSQLYASESDRAYWGGRAPKVSGGVVVEVGRDERFISLIKDEVSRFYDSFESNKTPDLTSEDTLFITDTKNIEMFETLRALKTQMDAVCSQYETIEKKIKALATHSRVKCLDVTISEVLRSGAIDFKKIPEVKALSPEYLETFRARPSKSKRITFGKTEAE